MKKAFDPGALTGENNPLIRFPRLYEAALDEFSAKSWGEASLNDILRQAGVSKGSLYHHFGDKFGLYLALMDRIAQRKWSFFMPRLQELGAGGDFFSFIKALSREMMAFMFQDERMYRLTGRLLSEDPALVKRLTDCFPQQKEGMFLALAETAVRTGQIDPRFSPEFVRGMLDILFSNLHLLRGADGSRDAFHQLELALDMMQFGLCGSGETKGQEIPPSDKEKTESGPIRKRISKA